MHLLLHYKDKTKVKNEFQNQVKNTKVKNMHLQNLTSAFF